MSSADFENSHFVSYNFLRYFDLFDFGSSLQVSSLHIFELSIYNCIQKHRRNDYPTYKTSRVLALHESQPASSLV